MVTRSNEIMYTANIDLKAACLSSQDPVVVLSDSDSDSDMDSSGVLDVDGDSIPDMDNSTPLQVIITILGLSFYHVVC